MSTGKIALAKLTNFWTIDSFSTYCKENMTKTLKSPEFLIGGYNGYLDMEITNSAHPINKDAICLHLIIRNLYDKKMKVYCKFSILDLNKKEVLFCDVNGFVTHDFCYGCSLINVKDLMNISKTDLLPNDKLTIVTKITILEQTANVHFAKCSEELENLFENKDFTDTTLLVNDKKIQVHRAILASKSPVFYAMFNNNTKEKNDNSIEIVDIDYIVLLELVRFIYTNNVKNFHNISKELLIAADKYDINDLKDMCENYIVSTIDLENPAEMFIFADLYNSSLLKSYIEVMIEKNIKRFIKTTGFLQFKNSHSSVLLKMLCSSIEKTEQNHN